MPRFGMVIPCATGPPADARPPHVRSTRRHKVLSAKKRAPTPNSVRGERRKQPLPIPDMAEDRKIMEIPIRPSNKLCVNVLTYCCTCCCAAVHGRWLGRRVGRSGAVRAAAVVLDYCCSTAVHGGCGWLGG